MVLHSHSLNELVIVTLYFLETYLKISLRIIEIIKTAKMTSLNFVKL